MAGHTFHRVAWQVGVGVLALAAAASTLWAAYIEEEFSPPPPRPRIVPRPEPMPPPPVPPPHVPELIRFLDRLEVRRPLVFGRLAVFPVVLRGGPTLPHHWWTMDEAIARGQLVVRERDAGPSVPIIVMENRGRGNVFVMAGEVVSGGKQTRTIRQDIVLVPGQRVDVPALCVEAHRWRGGAAFDGAKVLVPQSIQKAMRQGAGQDRVWAEVARNNAALGTENATGSLAEGLKAGPVAAELDRVRRAILPHAPGDSVGFVFVDRVAQRGIGAEFFGRSDLALALLGKLIDAYAVDLVLPRRSDRAIGPVTDGVAWAFIGRIRRSGSFHTGTPGSGIGIRMRHDGLVGDGVGLAGDLVHFGCQMEDRIVGPAPVDPRRRSGPAMVE